LQTHRVALFSSNIEDLNGNQNPVIINSIV